MKCKYSSSETTANFCHKMLYFAHHTTAAYKLFRRNEKNKSRPLKASITFCAWVWARQTWEKVKGFCWLAGWFNCTLFTRKKGRQTWLLTPFLFLSDTSSTFLCPSRSVSNAADVITIPHTGSFTQERLWSDTPRTQFLPKPLLVLHWMATNLWQNSQSGPQGITAGKGMTSPTRLPYRWGK